MDADLRLLWLRFKGWCTENRYGSPSGPAFSRSSLNRDTRCSYPELSSHYKAAVVKLLVLWVSHQSMLTDRDPIRRLHAWSLAEWVMLLSEADVWLTSQQQQRAYEVGRIYLLAHARLAQLHLAVDPLEQPAGLFFVRPKHHTFDHMAGRLSQTRAGLRTKGCSCLCYGPRPWKPLGSTSQAGPEAPVVGISRTPTVHVPGPCVRAMRSGITASGPATPCTFSARARSRRWARSLPRKTKCTLVHACTQRRRRHAPWQGGFATCIRAQGCEAPRRNRLALPSLVQTWMPRSSVHVRTDLTGEAHRHPRPRGRGAAARHGPAPPPLRPAVAAARGDRPL